LGNGKSDHPDAAAQPVQLPAVSPENPALADSTPTSPVRRTSAQNAAQNPSIETQAPAVTGSAAPEIPALDASGVSSAERRAIPTIGVASFGTNPPSIAGKVRLLYTPEQPEVEITPIRADRNCGPLHDKPVFTRRYLVGTDRGLANVIVSIKSGLEGYSFSVPAVQVLIDQIGCMYEPYVASAMANQAIVFRNSDPFMHNVNAQTKLNPGFNVAQASQGQENLKTFSRPETIKLICNVHTWMTGYLRIFDHPFHAVTDINGEFALPPGLPDGKYTVEFQHLKAGTQTADIETKSGKTVKLDLDYVSQ
jgi:plastocyanin